MNFYLSLIINFEYIAKIFNVEGGQKHHESELLRFFFTKNCQRL